eukprot:1992673-Rhodomonas_salina.1
MIPGPCETGGLTRASQVRERAQRGLEVNRARILDEFGELRERKSQIRARHHDHERDVAHNDPELCLDHLINHSRTVSL